MIIRPLTLILGTDTVEDERRRMDFKSHLLKGLFPEDDGQKFVFSPRWVDRVHQLSARLTHGFRAGWSDRRDEREWIRFMMPVTQSP